MRSSSLRALHCLVESLAAHPNSVMAANAPMFTKASMVDGRPEVGILPTGQVVGVIDELPTVKELVSRIIADAEATLERLTAR